MRVLDNVPIGVKVFFAPLFAVLGFVALMIFGLWALDTQQRAFRDVATVAFPKATRSTDLASTVQTAHTQLYQLLTWSAAGVDANRLEEIGAGFKRRLDDVETQLAAFAMRFPLDAQEQNQLARIRTGLAQYRPFALNTVDMASVEFTDAVSFLWTAHLDYETLLAALQQMETIEAAKALEAYQQAEATNNRALIWFMALATVILLTTVLAALVVGAKIANPVRCMTTIMRQLAEGDTTVTVPATGRRDEIGDIAGAVEVFKHNAIRVIERTRELSETLAHLRRTQDELVRSEKLAALGGMVASVAHEINTPLGNALTVSTTLVDKAYEFQAIVSGNKLKRSQVVAFATTLHEAADLLIGNLRRAAELVGSFKRIAVDQATEARRRFDLHRVTHEVVTMLRPTHKHSGHTVVVSLPPETSMDGYPGAYGQVITNLVNNAFIHAFEGRRNGRIGVTLGNQTDEILTVLVEDDGIGIHPENVSRIWDPFFTTRFGSGGSGLGLHIVYALVTRVLGGRIDVTSIPGQGTRFTVHLPRTAPVSQSVATATTNGSP